MKDESPIHILWLPTILVLGITYVVSMLDFLPDTIIGIGWLDDIAVIIALIWFFTSWLPRNRHRIYWFSPGDKTGKTNGQGRGNNAPRREERTEFDAFDVLKVRRDATVEEIKRAYKEMLSKYHPDKVAHLGEELQQKAHEKSIEIKRAYEMLCGKG